MGINLHVYHTLINYFTETFSSLATITSVANIKTFFFSEAEEALLINFSEDCKYLPPLFRLSGLFHFLKTTRQDTQSCNALPHHPAVLHLKACLKPKNLCPLFSSWCGSWVTKALRKNAQLCHCSIALLCFAFSLHFHCVYEFRVVQLINLHGSFSEFKPLFGYELKEKKPLSYCWNSKMMIGLRLSLPRWRVFSNKVSETSM